ncbi:hypothetical protein RB653_001383 [Dictyostelium firmibasis]|uniref:ADP-ribosylglycohydrolase n=1 Tax=Dictyostelium firmibasis TaxID=79012 RepID=A0AAN7U505_9MYCE
MSFQNKDNLKNIEKPKYEIKGLTDNKETKRYINNLLGMIYGNCLGDAYGLSTEFLNKEKIKELYPKKDEFIEFPGYITNRHNSRWDKGDWTDDSDQMILIMQSFLNNKDSTDCNKIDPLEFSKLLKNWVENGFQELSDQCGMGLGQTVGSVVFNQHFSENPTIVSKYVWLDHKKSMAANGSLMRTSIISAMDFLNEKTVLENTIDCCRITHYDSRCIVSCIVFTHMLSTILKYQFNNNDNDDDEEDNHIKILEDLVKKIDQNGLYESIAEFHFNSNKMVDENLKEDYLKQFNVYVRAKEWDDLALDDSSSIGYVYKCLGSSILTIRKYLQYYKDKKTIDKTPSYLFRKVMDELIREGGDSDTNGAVAGALLGCIIGYSNLPKDMLLEMPNKSWLDVQVVDFINLVNKRIENDQVKPFTVDKKNFDKLNLSYLDEIDSNPNTDFLKPKSKNQKKSNLNEQTNENCIIQ